MKAGLGASWAFSPSTLRRAPTPTEIAGGFPCGPWDLALFNELVMRAGQANDEIANALIANGITPDETVLNQLAAAIKARATTQIKRGFSAALNAVQAIPNNTATIVSWPGAIVDSEGVWNGAQPTRIPIPSGSKRLQVSYELCYEASANGSRKSRILLNSAAEGYGLPASRVPAASGTDVTILQGTGGIVDISLAPFNLSPGAGNYLQLEAIQDSGAALNLRAANTWISINWAD